MTVAMNPMRSLWVAIGALTRRRCWRLQCVFCGSEMARIRRI
jgi:hypothetical protein